MSTRLAVALGYDCVCCQCHKKFFLQSREMWAYKRSLKVFCSYSCLRKYDRGEPSES